jgi:protein-S-isoprenylcysteine O-methyltransferase Ste14
MSDVTRGWMLVGLQGLLFLAVAVAAVVPGPTLWKSLWLSLSLVVVGAAGVIWAARDLGSSLTPLPIPNGVGLAAAGVYHWVRHPMYSALVVICLGVAIGSGKAWSYVAVAALAVFFEIKTRMEEKFLLREYEGYAAYAAQTGKFLPGIARRN